MLFSTTTRERRRHPRQPARLSADYLSESLDLQTSLADVSEGGAFVRSTCLDDVGASVVLIIACFPVEERAVITGQVVRTEERPSYLGPTGMAVRFDPLIAASQRLIRSYCNGFSRLRRVALVDDDEDRATRLGRQIEAVGIRPTWLPARELSEEELLRLRPHVVVLRWPDHALEGARVIEPLRATYRDLRLPVLLTAEPDARGAPQGVATDEQVPSTLLSLMAETSSLHGAGVVGPV